jgi:hypothetical protein
MSQDHLCLTSKYLNDDARHLCSKMQTYQRRDQIVELLSFSSHFSFFVLVDKSYKKMETLRNSLFDCFLLFFVSVLPVLPCKWKTLYRKSRNRFGNFVNQNRKQMKKK